MLFRYLLLWCCWGIMWPLAAQDASVDSLLQLGKAEFTKPFEDQDFAYAVQVLEAARALDSAHTEVHYFLGYAYDRLNMKDATLLGPGLTHDLTLRASAEFEYIIAQDEPYTGELLISDPYSKLTAIWGAQAMRYWYDGKSDSLQYALVEGKRRGGFPDVVLEFNRNLLQTCPAGAILFSSGDNITWPLLYLQAHDSLRLDVQVIDVSMLQTEWYGELLQRSAVVDMMRDEIDFAATPLYKLVPEGRLDISIPLANCSTSSSFDWLIKDLRQGNLLHRGDLRMKEIITQNAFRHPVCFSVGFRLNDMLGLVHHLQRGALVDEVSPCAEAPTEEVLEAQLHQLQLARLKATRYVRSPDAQRIIEYYRHAYLRAIEARLQAGDKAKARELLASLKRQLPYDKSPSHYPSLAERIAVFEVELQH